MEMDGDGKIIYYQSYSYNLIYQSISIHMLIFPPVGKEGPGSEISMFQDADGEKGL